MQNTILAIFFMNQTFRESKNVFIYVYGSSDL